MQWIHAIWRDVGKNFRPGRWTKICLLTSEKWTATTSTVATEPSEKILSHPSFLLTVPLAGGKQNQHEAAAPAGVDHAVDQLSPPARHW